MVRLILGIRALLFISTLTWRVGANKLRYNEPLPNLITSSTYGNDPSRIYNLTILASINYSGRVFPLGTMCTQQIRIALDQMKKIPNFLSEYEISVEPKDDMYSFPLTVSAFVGRMRQNDETERRLPLYLGPFSGIGAITGRFYKYFDVIGFTSVSPSPAVHSNRDMYNGVFVIAPSFNPTYLRMKKFLETMNWKKVGIISGNSQTTNLIEKSFIDSFDKEGEEVIISKYPDYSGLLLTSRQAELAVSELAKSKTRIIVMTSLFPARIACWMHRFGLYGPNYIILALSFTAFDKYNQLKIRPWCTEHMLEEVLESVIFFGHSNEMNLGLGDNYDTFELTGIEMEQNLVDRIEDVQAKDLWWYWRSLCYDMTLTALVCLNNTEATLKSQNDSLTNWVTNSENFKNNGGFIKDALIKGAAESEVKVKLGSVHFDSVRMENSRGRIWTAFSQVQKGNKITVASTDESGKIIFGPNPILWRTNGGKVPVDRIRIVTTERFMLPSSSGVAIVVISVIAICIVMSCLIATGVLLEKGKLEWASGFNYSILLGDMCLLISLVIPATMLNAVDLDKAFMTSFALLLLGVTILLSGLLGKLEIPRITLAWNEEAATGLSHQNNLKHGGSKRSHPHHSKYSAASRSFKKRKISLLRKKELIHSQYIGLLAVVVQLILLVLWFSVDPIQIITHTSSPEVNQIDNSVAYQDIDYRYKLGSSFFTTVPIAIVISVVVVVTLRSIYIVAVIKSKHFTHITGFSGLTSCFYATVVIVVAGGVTSLLIFQDSQTPSQLSLAITCFLVVLLNVSLIVIPELAS